MRTILAYFLWGICSSVCAQQFDEYFDGRTLRLDYIFAGDSAEQHIYFEQAAVTPQWAGRRSRLAEAPLRGNGQISLRDHTTGQLLFVHTFSTLFQEWQTTQEATQIKKAFEASYNVPMPRKAVDVSVTLSDIHAHTVGQLTHTIDPTDILIRQLGDNGIPYYYIWKGEGAHGDTVDITSCIDLAIVAEGYSHAQMGKFYHDCQRTVDALFSHEPFTTLKNRFNVVAIAAESLDDGPSIPQRHQWKLTPAGTHYDTFYTSRYLMTQDIHRLYDILSGVPFEHIIVLVNSNLYGGGGIYNQVNIFASDHPTFPQVLVHEFGHGFAGLGDEYFYDDNYISQYPADTEPWEPNLTTLKDFHSKWADLLPEGTLIPTPPVEEENLSKSSLTQRIGVFEGGGYQSHGVYRPAQECRMKINEVDDFCPVCTRAILQITDFYTSR